MQMTKLFFGLLMTIGLTVLLTAATACGEAHDVAGPDADDAATPAVDMTAPYATAGHAAPEPEQPDVSSGKSHPTEVTTSLTPSAPAAPAPAAAPAPSMPAAAPSAPTTAPTTAPETPAPGAAAPSMPAVAAPTTPAPTPAPTAACSTPRNTVTCETRELFHAQVHWQSGDSFFYCGAVDVPSCVRGADCIVTDATGTTRGVCL